MRMPIVLLAASATLYAASIVAPGAKLINEGAVQAGEGPAWSPRGELFFTGGNRISRRDAKGQVHVFREPSGGAN